MNKKRWTKWILIFCLPVTVMVMALDFAWAKYPDKPITFIMPVAAGGGTDATTRPLALAAGRILGQPMMIEYFPGGNTAVGLGILKSKKPDGYTISMVNSSGLVTQLTRKVSYDIKTDFSLLMQFSDYITGIAVLADAPWKNLKEFIEYGRANPGKVRFASSGPGNPQHLATENLLAIERVKMIHIPFEGAPAALSGLLGRHVEAYATTTHIKQHVQAGKLRFLNIYGDSRWPISPEIPTLTELGYNDIYSSFLGLGCLKDTPPEIKVTLHDAFKKAMQDPDFIKAAEMVDQVITYRNSDDFTKLFLKTEAAFTNVLRDLKMLKQ